MFMSRAKFNKMINGFNGMENNLTNQKKKKDTELLFKKR